MSISCSEQASIGSSRFTMDVLRISLAVILLLALTGASLIRNSRWHTLLSMWEDCARKSPNKSRTHNNLGNCYLLLNRHFPAIEEYQKAVMLEPGNLEAQYNLATTLDAVGLYNQAMRPFEVFCRLAPTEYAEQRARACRRLEELLATARVGTGRAR